MGKRVMLFRTGLVLIMLICVVSLFTLPHSKPVIQNIGVLRAKQDPEQELKNHLESFFTKRTAMLVSGVTEGLERYYDKGETTGVWALESEQARIEYVHQWAENRRVQLLNSKCVLSVVSLELEENRAWASVCPHIIITYQHGDSSRLDMMGARTIHWLELVNRDNSWLIRTDWFLDPFEGGRVLPAALKEQITGGEVPVTAAAVGGGLTLTGNYNRQAAVEYVNRYAGVRLGPSTGRYNQEYLDYSMGGGDCANFASQVLADEKAGGLPQDWIWFYGKDGGSQAWVQAEAFVNYFLGSGRARCIMRGSYQEVSAETAEYPRGAIRVLQPGDIIGYEFDGMLSHVSIVVGLNSAGYVLVNSHSADRFQVPWDLGYDRNTTFWLLQIKG